MCLVLYLCDKYISNVSAITRDTVSPTNAPTNPPTKSPTHTPTDPYLQQNPNLIADCTFNDYCYEFTLGQIDDVDSNSETCDEICVQSRLLFDGMVILFGVNLANSIIEIIAFIIDLLFLCAWSNIKYRLWIFYILIISQTFCVFVDIPLEIASGSIIIDYDMNYNLNLLYENQCFNRLADGSIKDMISDIEQILWCSWVEALISIIMFGICIMKMRKWRENIDNNKAANKWVFSLSILAGLFNVILAALAFFVFTLPTYNSYLELYDSIETSQEQPIMSCWIKYDT